MTISPRRVNRKSRATEKRGEGGEGRGEKGNGGKPVGERGESPVFAGLLSISRVARNAEAWQQRSAPQAQQALSKT